jgi:hypothetical protein
MQPMSFQMVRAAVAGRENHGQYNLLGDDAENSEARLTSALSSAFKAGVAGLALDAWLIFLCTRVDAMSYFLL